MNLKTQAQIPKTHLQTAHIYCLNAPTWSGSVETGELLGMYRAAKLALTPANYVVVNTRSHLKKEESKDCLLKFSYHTCVMAQYTSALKLSIMGIMNS